MTIRLGIIGAGNHFYKKVMPSLKIIKNVKIEAIYTRAKEDDTKLGLFTEKNFLKKN